MKLQEIFENHSLNESFDRRVYSHIGTTDIIIDINIGRITQPILRKWEIITQLQADGKINSKEELSAILEKFEDLDGLENQIKKELDIEIGNLTDAFIQVVKSKLIQRGEVLTNQIKSKLLGK